MPPDTPPDTALRAAVFLDKGGTGKTTSAAHLGVAAHQHGHDVLLIDLAGKQGDLAKQFGLWTDVQEAIANEDDWPNISTVFQDEWSQVVDVVGEADAVGGLIKDTGEGPDLIPAHPGLDELDGKLNQIDDVHDRYTRLDAFLTEYIDPLGYDVVLIDLPGLTNNVTYNGLLAAGSVIAPVEMGPFESDQTEQLEVDIDEANTELDQDINLVMVIPNRYDDRTRLDSEYREKFQDAYPNAIAPSAVPKSQDIRNAAESGTTAFGLDDPSSTAKQAQDAFLTNADDLITRLKTI